MKALLLNGTYEGISFISFESAIKLYVNNKIDILAEWDDFFCWGSGKMRYPAVIKLKYNIKLQYRIAKFNRFNVFKRDQYICQYCSYPATKNKLTVDHIIPKSRGGESSYLNCVAACKPCNIKKANKTPEEAGMKLIQQPSYPATSVKKDYFYQDIVHKDWKYYLGLV